MQMTELMNCDKEPIHIPGKIQSHGFVIAIDSYSKIKFCSQNISEFIPVSAEGILNHSLIQLVKYFHKKDRPDFFTKFIPEGVKMKKWEFINPFLVKVNDQSFYLVISRSGDYFLLEFELEETNELPDLHRLIRNSLSTILANAHLESFLFKCAQEIRKIIRYDRVMIYQFHEDGHGEVVAEDKEENLSPFLGLHYPETDIPKQARELYKINLVRLIANVYQNPSDLVTDIDPLNSPLDLTHSVLRAVSPVHIQYLKNMNVVSSFSISLIHKEKLWGLIACHNYTPRFINYKCREAASFIAQVISTTLGFQEKEEDQQKKHRLKIAVGTLAKQLSRSNTIEDALLNQDISLMDAVSSTGAVLVIDGKIDTIGITPDIIFLQELLDWLNVHMTDHSYITNRFPFEFLPAEKEKEFCSGILALRISRELNDYLIWLRPEVVSNVNWGGDPKKVIDHDEAGKQRISPRKSFDTWAQTVLNTSVDWENEDIHSALELREEVSSSIIGKAAAIRNANQKLNEAYNTLDAFSYTISHDLRTPLTIINAYAQMLQEDLSSDPAAVLKIEGILNGTKKMNLMIRRILHYSQIGQSNVQAVPINMKKLLKEIRQETLILNNHPSTQIIVEETPEIFADETMTMQVFSNLITNAVKYSSKAGSPKVIINGKDSGSHVEYSITDNGIGIKEIDKEKIFELFTRSADVADFEGSGVGLSIVRRIMEKHDGQVWLESDGKSGSTFYVRFQKQQTN